MKGFGALGLRINIGSVEPGVGHVQCFLVFLVADYWWDIWLWGRKSKSVITCHRKFRSNSADTTDGRVAVQLCDACYVWQHQCEEWAGLICGFDRYCTPAALLPSSLPNPSSGGGRSAPWQMSKPRFMQFLLNQSQDRFINRCQSNPPVCSVSCRLLQELLRASQSMFNWDDWDSNPANCFEVTAALRLPFSFPQLSHLL